MKDPVVTIINGVDVLLRSLQFQTTATIPLSYRTGEANMEIPF